MRDTYKAVEVSAPGVLRVVERPVSEHGAGQVRIGWKHAESVTPMRPRSRAFPGLTLPRVPGHEVVGPALKPSVAECLDGKSVNGLVSACSDRVNPGALWLSARAIKRKLVRTKGVF